jgi:4-hydroxy-tetrahydrodipicolinate synthase/2-keto-3-deoxy-L-arabinonate dehydratase
MIDAGSDGLCILANFSEQFLLADDERECSPHHPRACAGRVPVIVTTTHFSTRVCAERSRRAQDMGAAHADGDAALPRRHLPRGRAEDPRVLLAPVRRGRHPDHDPGRTGAGTPLSGAFLARMAKEIEHVAYFKIETAGAAAKLRELIRLGGDAIEGPWDGEEAITLLPDLDAGATGAMTGGGYPTASGRSSTLRAGRRDEAIAAYERWLPLINIENRQCGPLAAKSLMKEGGVIACEAPRHPFPGNPPDSRALLIEDGSPARCAGVALGGLSPSPGSSAQALQAAVYCTQVQRCCMAPVRPVPRLTARSTSSNSASLSRASAAAGMAPASSRPLSLSARPVTMRSPNRPHR